MTRRRPTRWRQWIGLRLMANPASRVTPLPTDRGVGATLQATVTRRRPTRWCQRLGLRLTSPLEKEKWSQRIRSSTPQCCRRRTSPLGKERWIQTTTIANDDRSGDSGCDDTFSEVQLCFEENIGFCYISKLDPSFFSACLRQTINKCLDPTSGGNVIS